MRRLAALAVSAALVLSACSAGGPDATEATDGATSSPSQAQTPPEVAAAASQWLSGLDTDHGLFRGAEGADYETTVNAALAYLSLGDDASASEHITALIRADSIEAYVGKPKKISVARAARLISTVMASGFDPSDLSGRHLVAELKSTVDSSGRFVDGAKDQTTAAQAWGVLALTVADRTPAKSLSFLEAQECKTGGFPAKLIDSQDGKCKGNVVATAVTLSALAASGVPLDDPVVERTAAWLTGAAESNVEGMFWLDKAGEPDLEATALATIALTGARSASGEPLRWLRAHTARSGQQEGAFLVDDQADAGATALGIIAFAGRGLGALFS